MNIDAPTRHGPGRWIEARRVDDREAELTSAVNGAKAQWW
jgi:hypothetical protein